MALRLVNAAVVLIAIIRAMVDRLVDAGSAEQAVGFVEGLLHVKATWLHGCPHVHLFSTEDIRADDESVLVIG